MRRAWLLAGIAVVLAVGVLVATRRSGDDLAAMALAAQARAEAQAAGFKLDLREFDFALDEPARRRLAAVTNAGALLAHEPWLWQWRWMQPVAPGAAVSGWHGESSWAAAEIAFRSRAAAYDAAVAALLEPELLRGEPIVRDCDTHFPHLAPLGQLAHALTARMVLDLRAGRHAEAWTNLLAVNTLAARYEPEPFFLSLSMSSALARRAFAATWEALRTNAWSDAQLAYLASLWETPRLWQAAEDTPSVRTAELFCWIKQAREEARTNRFSWAELTPPWSTLLTDPVVFSRETWRRLRLHRQNRLWARRDSYVDEAILIGFQRERQEDLRRAAAQPDWTAMQSVPGTTQAVQLTLTTNHSSKMQAMIKLQAVSFAFMLGVEGPDPSLIRLLAEQEARRRVLLAALAIERFRLRTGRLPAALEELPGLLPDFADGAPLRYRPSPDGTYFLYSPGTDGVDDGGRMTAPPRETRRPRTRDLVWPRLATTDEAEQARARRDLPRMLLDPATGEPLRLEPPPNHLGVRFPEE